VSFAGIEFHNYALAFKIDGDILHAADPHKQRPKFAHALVAIFTFGRDLDRFDNRMIRAFGIVRIVWFHQLSNAARSLGGCFARDRLENTPDIFR